MSDNIKEEKKNSFLKGAAILGIAGILVKIMGVFFRIPITNWVGADGMSYYNSVYPIYTFFLILSTAGIPVAISRMVSQRIAIKNYEGAQKVFSVSVWLMAVIGAVSFLIVYFGAGFIESVVLANPGTKFALEAIAPSLLIVPVMSAYRGYFQGRQNMNPTAVSQFVEQFFRVVVGLVLAHMLISAGNQYVSAGAIFGCTFGAGAGLLVVVVIYLLSRKSIFAKIEKNKEFALEENTSKIIKSILLIAIPITIGACILPLVNAIDSMVVMRRLQATGWTLSESRVLWGRLGGYCSSLIGMPQVFIQAIVMSLVPAIAASYQLNNKPEVRDNMRFAMRAAMLIGFPCMVGMFSMAKPILLLLYPSQVQEATDAAPTLMIWSISIVFLSIMQTLTGALQGIDKQMIPVKNLAIGAACKVVLTFILVGIPAINVNGAPIGTIVCYLVAAVLNIKDVYSFADVKFDPMLTYIKPFVCSVLMGIAARGCYGILFEITSSNALSTLVGIIIAVIVYGLLVLFTGTITTDEIAKLPKGDKIARMIGKVVRKKEKTHRR